MNVRTLEPYEHYEVYISFTFFYIFVFIWTKYNCIIGLLFAITGNTFLTLLLHVTITKDLYLK